MTALPAYDRLECEGRYRPTPEAPAEAVVVTFGDRSLTVMSFADEPITHWPLASLARSAGPAPGGVTVMPDAAAPERLEIDDPAMVAALAAVCDRRGVRSLAPRPRRRLPGWVPALLLLGSLGAGAAALAPRAADLLAASLPASAHATLGAAALRAHAGPALCSTPAGERALAALARQLPAPDGSLPGLMVAALPADGPAAVGAAGGQVLLAAWLLTATADPAVLAAAVAQARAGAADHTAASLRRAGLGALGEVMTGRLTGPVLMAAAVAELRPTPPPAADTVAPARLALTPAHWLALRRICGR